MADKVIETKDYKVWKNGQVFFCVYYIDPVPLEVAKEVVHLRLNELADGKPDLMFMDLSTGRAPSRKEVRDYLGGPEAARNIKAAVIFAPSIASKLLATFFLGFTKPKVPIKVFANYTSALNWLKEFEDETVEAENDQTELKR